ncbi:sensor histidine kinase [Aureimonas sp. AU20]|uniref:sensor histidine kinase n=1 Tax=Aureimonas sp. AU20 TaxID=1349819 RepID=UPI000720F96A|nr:ATP-binding protein [Aureimonas sp. AU20]ALN75234.1 hypothetical protein M673_21100 [Aureimonas sp. AU20]
MMASAGERKREARRRPRWRLAALAVLTGSIFVADTVTHFEIAVAVFYTAVILLAIELLSVRGVVALAVFCAVLTVASLFLTRSGAFDSGLMNCAISVLAIAVTTYLSLKLVAAKAAVFEAQAKLGQMARLTRLGELTASIAHEINQPLAAISMSAQAGCRWLNREPPDLAKAQQALGRVVEAANRAGDVIIRVRGLAKGEMPRKQRLDLNEMLREATVLAQGEIERNAIALSLDLAEGLPPLLADKVQLQQVMANLLLNAIEAMSAVPEAQRELEIASFREGARDIGFSISDTGVGLGTNALDHLFDSFWTSKEGGMGIGLTISRSIVEAHGGRIWATSKPRLGAVFRCTLPSCEGDDT